MWLIICREHPGIKPELVRRVLAIESQEPPEEGAYPPDKFEIKEWDGPTPSLGNLAEGILPDLDPTLDDPDYADFQEARGRFDELAEQAAAEITWLEETIPQIDGMAAAEVRTVVKRLARENLEMIRAWLYVIRRLT